ncbi:MAG: hypothetical protein WBW16_01420 [Bacteroidota bacterium]
MDVSKLTGTAAPSPLDAPLGRTGTRLMTTLIHEMRRRKIGYGLATMYIGVGQGIATIVESTGL